MPAFVIEFDRKTRARRVHTFDNARDAIDFRLRLEGERTNHDVEIAALFSKSRETLERTHSRYFTGRELDAQTPAGV
jgi:hypothetical protein